MAGKPRDKGAGGAVTSPEGMHLGLRLGPRRAVQLRALVDQANQRAREVGIPANVTPSSMVMMWLCERLDAAETEAGAKPWRDALRERHVPAELRALEADVEKKVQRVEAERLHRVSSEERKPKRRK